MIFPNNTEFKDLNTLLENFDFSSDGKGIGDDAYLLETNDEIWAISSDVSVEGVHYSFQWSSFEQALEKAVIANLSDIHAMGGKCSHLFFNLGANKYWSEENLRQLGHTLKNLSQKYDFCLAGGDFTRVKKTSFFSFTAVGKIIGNPLLRSNAEPSHKIYVTAPLGLSAIGLHFLQNEINNEETPNFKKWVKSCIQHHLSPKPNFKIGTVLSSLPPKIAAIDLSDGLSNELWHLAKQSNVQMIIHQDKLPIGNTLSKFKNIDFALHGGEEYCLLFTANLPDKIIANLNTTTPCYCIGEVHKGEGVFLEHQGILNKLPSKGWSI